jgi:hypothetical protein
MPNADICLFSPQSYFQIHNRDATVTAQAVSMNLPDGLIINIPFDPTVNLPTIFHPQPSTEEQDKYGLHLLSAVMANILDLVSLGKPLLCRTVANASNHNLSGPQRELLQWQWKLCINMQHLQELMQDRLYKVPASDDHLLPPILFTMNAST